MNLRRTCLRSLRRLQGKLDWWKSFINGGLVTTYRCYLWLRTRFAKCLHCSKRGDISLTRTISLRRRISTLLKAMSGQINSGESRRSARSQCCGGWQGLPGRNSSILLGWSNTLIHTLDSWHAMGLLTRLPWYFVQLTSWWESWRYLLLTLKMFHLRSPLYRSIFLCRKWTGLRKDAVGHGHVFARKDILVRSTSWRSTMTRWGWLATSRDLGFRTQLVVTAPRKVYSGYYPSGSFEIWWFGKSLHWRMDYFRTHVQNHRCSNFVCLGVGSCDDSTSGKMGQHGGPIILGGVTAHWLCWQAARSELYWGFGHYGSTVFTKFGWIYDGSCSARHTGCPRRQWEHQVGDGQDKQRPREHQGRSAGHISLARR